MISNNVIVLNYNDSDTTIKFIKNTRENKHVQKIIVVDNCSTDDSFEKLIAYRDEKVDVIKTESNSGYAKGNNYGWRYAKNKYKPSVITIANPDVSFTEEYIAGILEVIENDSQAGIVAGKMISKSEINRKLVAWKLPTYGDILLSNFILLRHFLGNHMKYDELELTGALVPVDVLPGSLLSLRTDVLTKTGGFCEETFLYQEENIFAYRTKKAGYQNYLVGNLSYLHDHAVSINKSIPNLKNRMDINFQSRLVYLNNCLNCGRIKLMVFRATYPIGKTNYLVASSIRNWLKHVVNTK